jgi:pyruvate dehydrogenase E2 component (dihydrolipoamide acetyltransferase)
VSEGYELMSEDIFIPMLGQTVEEVKIIAWLVEDGAKVIKGQEILEVETDKAIFPIEANADGYLHIGPFIAGVVVPVLQVVAIIGDEDEVFKTEAVGALDETAPITGTDELGQESPKQTFPSRHIPAKEIAASPRAKRLALEKGIQLEAIKPTGSGGKRIVEADVVAFIEAEPDCTPVAKRLAQRVGLDLEGIVGSGPSGRIQVEDIEAALREIAQAGGRRSRAQILDPNIKVREQIPLSGVRKITFERMSQSAHETARVTHFMEVDAQNFVEIVEDLKAGVTESWGFRPGFNEMIALILARALAEYPTMNARLNVDQIEIMDEINIGFAVDTERGLLVPVIKNVDHLTLKEIGSEIQRLVDGVQKGKIRPEDLQGGTFTMTNLGMYQVDAFTPIINPPEMAILGIGKIAQRAVVFENELTARHMCTLCLTFDHRIVDGAPAAKFLGHLKYLMENPHEIDDPALSSGVH